MNGGLIEALGPLNAASVIIESGSVIQSTDRANNIAVAGVLALDSQIVDLSKSVVNEAPAFIDASNVLRAQCGGRRAQGRTSVFSANAIGPFLLSEDAVRAQSELEAGRSLCGNSRP
jgi:hypothetical protein